LFHRCRIGRSFLRGFSLCPPFVVVYCVLGGACLVPWYYF
jgi:hypothetical protein